ncbi:MAG TPA: hypothetical protein VHS96_08475 [Bacteroidia bacterium]|nr:hypothetical protein [Bacteroidia bacterium]
MKSNRGQPLEDLDCVFKAVCQPNQRMVCGLTNGSPSLQAISLDQQAVCQPKHRLACGLTNSSPCLEAVLRVSKPFLDQQAVCQPNQRMARGLTNGAPRLQAIPGSASRLSAQTPDGLWADKQLSVSGGCFPSLQAISLDQQAVCQPNTGWCEG